MNSSDSPPAADHRPRSAHSDGEGEEDDAEHHSHARLLMGDAQPSDVPLANSHPLQLPQPAGDEPLRRRWGSGPLEVDSGGLPASASTKVANDGTAAAHAGLMAALEIESDDSVRSGRELPSPTRLMPVLQQQSQQQPKQLGKNIDAEAVAGAPLLASAADAGPSQALLPRPPSRMLPGGIGPRKRTYMISIFSLVAALLYADQNLLAPNLTAAAEDFGFDETERDKYLGGWIAAGFYLVGAPAALLFGYLADRCNRRNMLFLAVLLGEGPCILTYFVTKYWQLLVLRLLTGISLGGALPLVFSLLGDLFDPSKRAAVSAMVQLATGIGLALGQGVAGFVGPAIGWRWPFVIVAMPAVLLAVVMLVTVPEPQRGGTEAALQVHFEETPGFHYAERVTWRKVGRLLAIPTNVFVIMQGLFGCLPWGMILTFLNDYLSQNKGLAVPTATTVLLVLGIGGGVGVVGGGAMGQWLYNRHKWSMPLFIGGCTILGTAPLWFLVNADVASMLWLAFIAAGAAGMLSGTVGPNMRAMILNVNEPETRGLALALQTMLDDLGKGAGPVLVAAIIGQLGREAAFNISTAGWIPCGLLLMAPALTLARDEAAMQTRLRANIDRHVLAAVSSWGSALDAAGEPDRSLRGSSRSSSKLGQLGTELGSSTSLAKGSKPGIADSRVQQEGKHSQSGGVEARESDSTPHVTLLVNGAPR